MIKRHLDLLIKTKPLKVALLEIRSHAAWYLKGLPNTKELKVNAKDLLDDIVEDKFMKVNPNIIETIDRLSKVATEENDYIEMQTDKIYKNKKSYLAVKIHCNSLTYWFKLSIMDTDWILRGDRR